MHLLLAEDDAVSRAFLTEALRAQGHAVEAVACGHAALERARADAFDLLLLDLNLPGLDGGEVLASLRRDAEARSVAVPALALTADTDAALHARLRDAGFVAVACKPLSAEALAALIQAHAAGAAGACWDDAAALRSAAGHAAIVNALREMLRRDLPEQRHRIERALAETDLATVRSELHKLRAACGFCGARRLGVAVMQLSEALEAAPAAKASALDELRAACAEVLAEAER